MQLIACSTIIRHCANFVLHSCFKTCSHLLPFGYSFKELRQVACLCILYHQEDNSQHRGQALPPALLEAVEETGRRHLCGLVAWKIWYYLLYFVLFPSKILWVLMLWNLLCPPKILLLVLNLSVTILLLWKQWPAYLSSTVIWVPMLWNHLCWLKSIVGSQLVWYNSLLLKQWPANLSCLSLLFSETGELTT